MKFLPITEVCDFQGGTQPPKNEWSDKPLDGYIRMLQIRDFTQSDRTTPEFVKNSKKLKTCSSDDVLIGRYGASIGKILTGHSGAYNVAIVKTIPNEKLLSKKFLLCLLRSPTFQNFITTIGARAAQAGFNKSDLTQFNIPVLPINDQIRIAHLLGKVEGMIALRKQHLKQLDDLLKSVFLEMFSDPVRNEKEWDVQPCEKAILDISSGTSYGGEDRPFESPDEIGVLKISAVTKGVFDPTEFKVVAPSQIKKALRFVKRGDFLFSRANTIELVAACCVVQKDYNQLFLPDKLWVITINQDFLVSQYFNFLLKNERYRGVVRNLASGGHDSMLNISMKKFMTLNIPCPPLDLQNQFATVVKKVEVLKSRYQQSLSDLESLYGALSQQAFKGELDLSRVPLPDAQLDAEASKPTEQVETPVEEPFAINLPDSDTPLPTFMDRTERKNQLIRWLDSYFHQIGNTPFSASDFLSIAQKRIIEIYPGNEFELGLDDYEQIKSRVFEHLKTGRLQQTQHITGKDENGEPILGNRVELYAEVKP